MLIPNSLVGKADLFRIDIASLSGLRGVAEVGSSQVAKSDLTRSWNGLGANRLRHSSRFWLAEYSPTTQSRALSAFSDDRS